MYAQSRRIVIELLIFSFGLSIRGQTERHYSGCMKPILDNQFMTKVVNVCVDRLGHERFFFCRFLLSQHPAQTVFSRVSKRLPVVEKFKADDFYEIMLSRVAGSNESVLKHGASGPQMRRGASQNWKLLSDCGSSAEIGGVSGYPRRIVASYQESKLNYASADQTGSQYREPPRIVSDSFIGSRLGALAFGALAMLTCCACMIRWLR